MGKGKLGISMINMYCDMIDKKANTILAGLQNEDEKIIKKTLDKMIRDKGMTKVFNELKSIDKKMIALESQHDMLEKELLSKFDIKRTYGNYMDKLECVAERSIVTPSEKAKKRIEDIKDRIRLSDSGSDVQHYFDNLDKYLK